MQVLSISKEEIYDVKVRKFSIIKSAGGVVTTWNNKDAIKAGSILVSANKSIHNKMLKILKPVSK